MIKAKRKQQKPEVLKTPEQEIEELKNELNNKQAELEALKEQVEIVQTALDDLILGGMM